MLNYILPKHFQEPEQSKLDTLSDPVPEACLINLDVCTPTHFKNPKP